MKIRGTEAEKARAYAFLLLKFRLRSEHELYQRLKLKKFPETIIRSTLDFLKEKQFIDDRVFAKAWINSRLKKPQGLRKIRQELAFKGIDKEIIESRIAEAGENYSEQEVVRKLACEKWDRLKGIEPEKAKRRLYSYLLRRGFSPEIVSDNISQLCKPIS